MITYRELADACNQIVDNFEKTNGIRADCIAIMHGVDPASAWIVVFPLPLADILAKRGEPELLDVLNPAEHADEFEISVPEDVRVKLPRGDDLQRLVHDTVAQMRRDMPDRLVYMTDPECSELAESVREARLPPALAWIASYL